jgi:glutamate 5-kinase
VLTRADGALDDAQVAAIAGQLAAAAAEGRRVALVSSGAVAAGIGRLGWKKRPTAVAELQAAAAVGQSSLMESYHRALAPYGAPAAQLLLTAEDLQDRTRYLNVRNTLWALFQARALPIINENDTVAVDELQISFGDNDRLAALVTNLLQAPLLVLLSDVEGVYDGDPSQPASQRLSLVADVEDARRRLVCDRLADGRIQLSRGGMASKLRAAGIVAAAGGHVVIASGRRPGALTALLRGEDVGTLILPEGPAVGARKRWIGWTAQPAGTLRVDDGAQRALETQGRSLLAVGVTQVQGDFAKGDVVALSDAQGREFARGLINYNAAEMRLLAGQTTERIAELLGHCPYDEAIHRNNLVLGKRGTTDPA